MAYLGNLTCGDCGLTFTSRWGTSASVDEYRCHNDHAVHVERFSGAVVSIDGYGGVGQTLVELRGLCPACSTELATGRLPACPVCGGRDHDVMVQGVV